MPIILESPTGTGGGGSGTVTNVSSTNTGIAVANPTTTPTLTLATLDVIAADGPPTADWSNNSKKITSVADPAAAQDAATKNYVDTAIAGLDWKQAVRLATAAALPANVYANGASGVGATLTGAGFGALTIDGSVVVVGDRVLVKNEVTGANNGIYVVTTVGAVATLYVLTRATDFNQASEIQAGDAVYATAGTANVDTSWVMTTTGAITVGTTSLTFTQFGGNLVASVFGRTGAVVATNGDYTASQVGALASTTTLNSIAAANATSANWSNNSKKITAVTPGASAGETATYEQTPASILTTKADVIVASAANTPARLAVGTQPGAALIADTQATNGVAYRRPISYDGSVPGAGNSYQTYERQYGAANTSVLATQQVFLFAVNLPSGFVATSITFVSATTPLGGGNHQLFGLYDDAAGSSGGSAYALLRGSSDDTSTAWGANTAKTLNLTSTYTTIRAGYFYLGILVDATTVPTLYTSAAVGSGLRALTPVAQGSSSTGRTTLPDPAAAPTALVNMTYAYVTGT